MTNQFESLQTASKDQLQHVTTTMDVFTNGMKAIAEETVGYSKRSMANSTSFFEKLVGQKTLETAVQLQSDFAKSQYEDSIAHMKKVGEIYQNMGKQAFRPFEDAVAKGTDAFKH